MKRRLLLICGLFSILISVFAYASTAIPPNPYKKPDQAFKYVYNLSVVQNEADPWASYLLGSYYEKGYGTKQDTTKAYIWYSMSATHDNYKPAVTALAALKAKMTKAQISSAEKQYVAVRNKQVSKFLKNMQHMNG